MTTKPTAHFYWSGSGYSGKYAELDGEFEARIVCVVLDRKSYEWRDSFTWEVEGSGLGGVIPGEAGSLEKAQAECDSLLSWAIQDLKRQNTEAAARSRARVQAQGPTRSLKREAARRERKANLRARQHDCVLAQAARAYNVHVQVDQGAEQHRLHIAMGEPTCPACKTCKELRAAGKPPTVISEEACEALLEYWELKVDQARGSPGARQRIASRREFEKAVFGG